jgi:cytochrome o ubiquinol oxidase subunit 2
MRSKLAIAAGLMSMSALSGCDLAVLNPKGPIAAQDGQILVDSVAIMLAIVVPTIAAIAVFAWWYRADNPRARYRPDFSHSGQLELVVWSIPALTVMLLAGVIWIGAHDLDPAMPVKGSHRPINIQAVSLDWKWLFLYPDEGVASVNELVAPVGAPLHIQITSASVMSAFFIPQWGSMIYAMNGMTTQLNLRADSAGEFLGVTSNLTGDGFSEMNFKARAVSYDDFEKWTKSATGPVFDDAAYQELSKQGVAKSILAPLADPNLFDDIASRKLPPGPGPEPSVRPKSVVN